MRAFTFYDTDAYLHCFDCSHEPHVAEALIGSCKYLRRIRKYLNREAERIEDTPKRQLHIAQQRGLGSPATFTQCFMVRNISHSPRPANLKDGCQGVFRYRLADHPVSACHCVVTKVETLPCRCHARFPRGHDIW